MVNLTGDDPIYDSEDEMNSDQIEMAVIVLLLFWNVGITIMLMMVYEQKHQLQGYIKRLERDGIRTRGDL